MSEKARKTRKAKNKTAPAWAANDINNIMKKIKLNNKSKINELKKCINQNCKKFTQKNTTFIERLFNQKKTKVTCVKKYCKNETDALNPHIASVIKQNVSKKDIKKLTKLLEKSK